MYNVQCTVYKFFENLYKSLCLWQVRGVATSVPRGGSVPREVGQWRRFLFFSGRVVECGDFARHVAREEADDETEAVDEMRCNDAEPGENPR